MLNWLDHVSPVTLRVSLKCVPIPPGTFFWVYRSQISLASCETDPWEASARRGVRTEAASCELDPGRFFGIPPARPADDRENVRTPVGIGPSSPHFC